MWDDKNSKSLRDIIEDFPKTVTKDYLQSLHIALFHQTLEKDIDVDAIISSLTLIVIDDKSPVLNRHFATVILQKLSPNKNISKVLTSDIGIDLVHAFPVLLMQDITDPGVKDVIRHLIWSLGTENWIVDLQWHLLAFIAKVIACPNSPIMKEELGKVSSLLSSWLIIPATVPASKPPSFRKSSSALSITEIDGTDTQDFFTVLNYASMITPQQLRSIQVFSVLKSYLSSSSECDKKFSSFTSENLIFSIREYCLRIIDQVDRRVQSISVATFQKACLVEAIDLFNVICLMDPAIVHSIFPVVRRIYDHICSNISKDPEAQDVAVLTSSMQFFMNHGSSVMHKPDSLYTYLFCDLLSICFKDNFVAFEIIHLMKQNLSQLCYHSSILEKYFPTFFKVLAWRPTTYLGDFLELLPAFMSQHTSVEVFHTLLDLPCLTAVLMLLDSKSSGLDPKTLRDPHLVDALKQPELSTIVKHMLRKTSSNGDGFESMKKLHQALSSLTSHNRVLCCTQAVIPLLKRFFEVFLKYADMRVTVVLIPAILERLSSIYPVVNYDKDIHSVFANSVIQLFDLHPETVFHCQKYITTYLSHFNNYDIAEQIFTHLVWIVGEYVSSAYSTICRPEAIALFFENLESTTYEALSFLQTTSDDSFLKLFSVSLTTLSKLAARNQDQVPRAVLCLSKVHQHLSSFGNDSKKSWKIVSDRVLELLSILNSPSVAAIVLSPPKDLESGKLHRDSTSLPYILRAITGVVTTDN